MMLLNRLFVGSIATSNMFMNISALIAIIVLASIKSGSALSQSICSAGSAKLRKLCLNNYNESGDVKAKANALPGVHDALSAKIYAEAGAKVLFVSGFGITATRLGLPDAGILTLSELEDATQSISNAFSDQPLLERPALIVDGDTGYGGPANIRRTVRSLARSGAAAITIEDQIFPNRKCTYAVGEQIRILNRNDSLERIEVALKARDEAKELDGNDVMIVARTDCRAALGLEEALERCEMYEELGADMVYAENLQSPLEYEELRKRLSVPTILAQLQTTPEQNNLLSLDDIGVLGYDFALFGVSGLQAIISALQSNAQHVLQTGYYDNKLNHEHSEKSSLASFQEVKRVVGFDDLEAFEKLCTESTSRK